MLTTGHCQTAGVGYATIQSILDGGTDGILLLAALFVGKLVATSISLGSGASGGVFSPSLFIGATLGAAFGALGADAVPAARASRSSNSPWSAWARIVGGATGASMTAIVMIFEMTRDYNVIVPLVLAVALAAGMRRALITENIYTIKLRHRGRPIPTIRHTNMYLVRQARELMNTDFIILPIDTRSPRRWRRSPSGRARTSSSRTGRASPAWRGSPPAPTRRTAMPARRWSAVTADDFVIAPDTAHPQHDHHAA